MSYTVIDAEALRVPPIETFFVHLVAKGRSSAKAYAHDLKDFFEWLGQRGSDFAQVDLEDLTSFMDWLGRTVELRQPDVYLLPGAPSASDNASLLRKRAALAEFYRFHAARGSAPPVLGGMASGTRRATGDFIPMLAHTMSGPVERSPLRIVAGRKRPKDLTDDEGPFGSGPRLPVGSLPRT